MIWLVQVKLASDKSVFSPMTSWPLVRSSLRSWPTTWNASVSEGICRQGTKQQFCFQARKVAACTTTTTATTTRPLLETSHQLFKLNGEEHETQQTEVQPPSTGARKAQVGKKKKKSWNAAIQPCSTRRTQSLQQFPSYISLAQKMLLPNKQAHRQNKLRRHVTAIGEAGRGKYKSSSVNKWSGGGAGGKRGRLLTGRFNMVTSVKCDSLGLLRVDHGCLENWNMSEWEKMK